MDRPINHPAGPADRRSNWWINEPNESISDCEVENSAMSYCELNRQKFILIYAMQWWWRWWWWSSSSLSFFSDLRSQSSLLQSSQQFAIYQSQVSLANYSSQGSRLKKPPAVCQVTRILKTQDSRQSTVRLNPDQWPKSKSQTSAQHRLGTRIYNIYTISVLTVCMSLYVVCPCVCLCM